MLGQSTTAQRGKGSDRLETGSQKTPGAEQRNISYSSSFIFKCLSHQAHEVTNPQVPHFSNEEKKIKQALAWNREFTPIFYSIIY